MCQDVRRFGRSGSGGRCRGDGDAEVVPVLDPSTKAWRLSRDESVLTSRARCGKPERDAYVSPPVLPAAQIAEILIDMGERPEPPNGTSLVKTK